MKATGIIVEYNPFHNGHKLHAKASRMKTNADVVIAVMSGHFLQRGEPAFIDKWTRAEMALKNGVDLIFELPYAYATGHATRFAKGAIQLLDAAQCKSFCFGSEAGEILPFLHSITLLKEHHTSYEQLIKTKMSEGMSYPNALNFAYKTIIDQYGKENMYIDLSKPNNILGFHYIEAAQQINSTMNPATIQRVGANFHDDQFTHEQIGSATSIRKALLKNSDMDEIKDYLPFSSYQLLNNQFSKENTIADWTKFYPFLRMIILRETPEQIEKIADITEGIEHLIYRAALTNNSFETFMDDVKSKRYTWTRIQRMLTHIFTRFTVEERNRMQTPSYLRLLGMNEQGRRYLNQYKKDFKLPIVNKVANHDDESLTMDIRSTNLYALALKNCSLINSDYKRHPIYVQSHQIT